jgi:hypothetical protein
MPSFKGWPKSMVSISPMSFDVKTDVPAPYLGVGLQSWPGNGYVGPMSSSVGYVPLPAGVPGQFQTVIVCLANPLWVVPLWDPSITTPFDPAGGTIQAELWQFGGPDSSATVTIDNLRFWTVELVAYKSSIQMQAVAQSDDSVTGIRQQVLEGKGISSHMGAVTVWAPDPFVGAITGTRTVTGGTGRFLGATGSMTLNGVDSDGVTLEVVGSISSVGSGMKVGLGK